MTAVYCRQLQMVETINRNAWSEPQVIQEIAASPKRPAAQYRTYETQDRNSRH
jgi:hypothetical protein